MAVNADSAVQLAGPWAHRTVSANGTRFHIAEAGDGPLVLLLHGFPEFWWTWRHQLTWLPEAGFRAVAVDLRGYGGSDKPPRGYDLVTAAADAAGLIRALGEANAIVVGRYAVITVTLRRTTGPGRQCPVPSRPEVPTGPDLRCLKFDGGIATVICQ
jgi:alpha/beta hydrolase family protein